MPGGVCEGQLPGVGQGRHRLRSEGVVSEDELAHEAGLGRIETDGTVSAGETASGPGVPVAGMERRQSGQIGSSMSFKFVS